MKIHGCFLCIGATVEPSVVLLSEHALEFMREKMKIAETRCKDVSEARARVYQEYFGAGIEYAIPAWSDEAMLSIVEHYQGPHSERVRQLAACIYTGKPYSADGDQGPQDGADGGQKAPIDPVKPKPTKPRGGARVVAPVSAAA